MHDTLRYFTHDPIHRKLPPQRADVPHDLRLHRELRAAALARRGRARQGLAARQDAGRRLAEVRQPARCSRLPCTRSRARSCCSWAASSASGASGTTTPASTGTCSTRAATPGVAAAACATSTALYRGEPALHERDCDPAGFEWIDSNDAEQSVLAFLRTRHRRGDRWSLVRLQLHAGAAPRLPRRRAARRALARAAQQRRAALRRQRPGQPGRRASRRRCRGTAGRQSLSLTLPPLGCVLLAPGEHRGRAWGGSGWERSRSRAACRFCVWAPRRRARGGRARRTGARIEPLPAGRGGLPPRGSGRGRGGRPLPLPARRRRRRPGPGLALPARGRARAVGGRRRRRVRAGPTRLARACRDADLVFYELHVGTFTPEGTFDGGHPAPAPTCASSGVTAVELMPVAEFPGARNWGYDGVLPVRAAAPTAARDGLQRLVDACHAAGLAVVLDVVYNHLGPEGNYLARVRPVLHRPLPDALGRGRQLRRRRQRRGARASSSTTRCCGCASSTSTACGSTPSTRIFDTRPGHILAELAEAAARGGGARAAGCTSIAESDLNDPRCVRPRRARRLRPRRAVERRLPSRAARALTGERGGYYADFGRARAAGRGVPRGASSTHGELHRASRGRAARRAAPSARAASASWSALQNHDQVGNRARGDRLSAMLLDPSAQRLAAASGAAVAVPAAAVHGRGVRRDGARSCSSLVTATRRWSRRCARAGTTSSPPSRWAGSVPDPQAEETFASAAAELARGRERTRGRALLALYRDLLRLPPRTEHRGCGDGSRRPSWMSAATRPHGLRVRRWRRTASDGAVPGSSTSPSEAALGGRSHALAGSTGAWMLALGRPSAFEWPRRARRGAAVARETVSAIRHAPLAASCCRNGDA